MASCSSPTATGGRSTPVGGPAIMASRASRDFRAQRCRACQGWGLGARRWARIVPTSSQDLEAFRRQGVSTVLRGASALFSALRFRLLQRDSQPIRLVCRTCCNGNVNPKVLKVRISGPVAGKHLSVCPEDTRDWPHKPIP